MSLRISVKCINGDGQKHNLRLQPGKHLGGFEVSRYNFWGADIMRQLGLVLLPQLKEGGFILVGGDELTQLEREATLIQANVELVLQHTPYDQQFVMGRTDNILHAIQKAREVAGEVMIG